MNKVVSITISHVNELGSKYIFELEGLQVYHNHLHLDIDRFIEMVEYYNNFHGDTIKGLNWRKGNIVST